MLIGHRISWQIPENREYTLAEDLAAVRRHGIPEAEWNSTFANVVSRPFDYNIVGTVFSVQIRDQTDLWDACLATSDTRFQDVPTQWQLVRMMLKRRFGENYHDDDQWVTSRRGTIGLYIPDMSTTMAQFDGFPPSSDPMEPPIVPRVISLTGEMKVTRLYRRNGRYVAAFDPRDWQPGDPDEWASHYSIGTGHNEVAVAQVDGVWKWRSGLAKQVVYMLSSNEYCNAYLGYFVLGDRYSRLVVVADDHFALECTEPFLAAHPELASFADLLDYPDGTSHLAWALSREAPVEEMEGGETAATSTIRRYIWDVNALDTLQTFTKLSVDVLEHHCRTTAQWASSLQPIISLGCPTAEALRADMNVFRNCATDEECRIAALEASRPVGPNRPVKAIRMSATTDDDGDVGPSGAAGNEDQDEGDQRPPPTGPAGATRSRTQAAAAQATAGAAINDASIRKVAEWRNHVDDTVPDLMNEPTSDTSFEVETPDNLAPDDVDKAAREVALKEMMKYYVDEDEVIKEEPSLDDMMQLFRARRIMVSLISTSKMDRLVSEISSAIAV